MVNKEIARQFNLLAGLMELYGENAFKTKAYANAYLTLRKWDVPLTEMSPEEIEAIPGIGSSVSSKIREWIATGKIEALEKYKAKTPEGVQQLLEIRGLGPKKVKVIREALQVESPAELLYACNENRLVKLPGFGYKTQEDLRQKIAYYLDSSDRYLYGHIEADMDGLLTKLRKAFPQHRIEWAGTYATRTPVIDSISCVIAPEVSLEQLVSTGFSEGPPQSSGDGILLVYDERIKVTFYTCAEDQFSRTWAKVTCSPGLYQHMEKATAFQSYPSIGQSLAVAGLTGLPPEWYDRPDAEKMTPDAWADLIEPDDLRGILHNHSTWSDGLHTLEEMAVHVRDAGYAYFAICDHSRSAGYAGGLSAERVVEQMEEIDRLNAQLAPFRIFKGIESDILGDGSLDYEPELLAKFDLVVASIHSNLRMDEERATTRLVTAIENPYTRILGHPTGRLLLSRQGYPVDHRRIIEACAANGVAIELNANPLRLDIDYTWLEYCMEKEVMVSINPDAHSRGQVAYVRYGVYAARKGGLRKKYCLNALALEEFDLWLKM